MRMASVPVSLLVCGAGASTSEDYVGLADLDVRTALTQLMESNEANPSICGCQPTKMTGGQTYDEDG